MKTGVLLLAAGRGRRFGADKRRARFRKGVSLLSASLQPILSANLPVLVCLRPGDEELLQDMKQGSIQVALCPDADEGMGASLAQGMVGVPADWDALLVALGDMPWISADSYLAVARTLVPGGIVVPQCGERRGHPVGFARDYFEELSQLSGDEGARSLLQCYRERISLLDLDDPGILRDVDTPQDLASR